MTIHPTAIVDPGANLGPDVTIGPFAIVEGETEIGAGCEIRARAVIKRYTRIGEGCVVHESAILGGEPQDLTFQECVSYVEIGPRTRLREGVTVHRGTEPGSITRVGSDCFFMSYAHVAHNCTVGDRVVLVNNAMLGGRVEVGERAFIGGGVGVHQFCRVGRLAMMGGNAKTGQDCLPFVVHDGIPARSVGANVVGMRRAGISAAGMRAVKESFRLLARSGLPLEEALARVSALGDPLADEMAAFVRASKRGFCHPARRGIRL